MQETSTKPYLLRALYEWCTDNGFTPHIAVRVDSVTRVPREFVRDGEIVLNISFEATSGLQIGNEVIEFSARFSGRSHQISVPVTNVLAIYARENGQGMAFPVETTAGAEAGVSGPNSELHEAVEDGSALFAVENEEGVEVDDAHHGGKEAPGEDGPGDGGKGGAGGAGGAGAGKGHLKIVK
jgi:stringent starvation protein B